MFLKCFITFIEGRKPDANISVVFTASGAQRLPLIYDVCKYVGSIWPGSDILVWRNRHELSKAAAALAAAQFPEPVVLDSMQVW